MDDSEVVTFGLQSADKEAVEDTLQESELESARGARKIRKGFLRR
jgi:hypothetical protein